MSNPLAIDNSQAISHLAIKAAYLLAAAEAPQSRTERLRAEGRFEGVAFAADVLDLAYTNFQFEQAIRDAVRLAGPLVVNPGASRERAALLRTDWELAVAEKVVAILK